MTPLISSAHNLWYAIPIFLALLNPVCLASKAKCRPEPAPATAPAVFSLSELADYYYEPPSDQSPPDLLSVQVSESQIRNKLSLYSIALDGKNFAALDYIFTDDVVANFSEPIGVVKGLANVKEVLQEVLEGVDTQNLIGTQLIEVDPKNPCTAKSLTYFTATFFGTGDQKGKASVIYGQFRDRWFQDEAREWRISIRLLVYIGFPLGNLLPT